MFGLSKCGNEDEDEISKFGSDEPKKKPLVLEEEEEEEDEIGEGEPVSEENSKAPHPCDKDQKKETGGKSKKPPTTVGEGFLKEFVFGEIDRNLDVVSVIVTTWSGSSFDNLFRSVEQTVPVGRVSLYIMESEGTEDMIDILKRLPKKLPKNHRNKIVKQFAKEVKGIDPDCVLFNFECCGGCTNKGFKNRSTIRLLETIIQKKYTVMCSDFSVKALIGQWDDKRLGPNPFIPFRHCQKSIQLGFDEKILGKCGCPQLEAVGKLCDGGVCNLHCLSGTIVFGVDWRAVTIAKKKKWYDFQILTIATKIDGVKTSTRVPENRSQYLCEVGDVGEQGTVGHAVLRYKKGGKLLVSAGHWVELSKLDTSIERIEEFAQQYGNKYNEEIQSLKSADMSKEERSERMGQIASFFVQQIPSVKSFV